MAAKFSLFTVAALPLIPIALACGGDDGGGMITVRPDGSTGADAGPTVCTASSTYNGVGGNVQLAGSAGMPGGTGSNAYQIYWVGKMNTDQQPDLLQVALFDGDGPFSGGITPQTIQLTGNQIDPTMCDACIVMFTDYHMVGSDSADYVDLYFATGGTLKLDETSIPGNLVGSLTNLTLTHYIQSGQSLVPANDGCNVTIGSADMNAMIGSNTGATGKGSAIQRFSLPHRTY